MIFIANICVFQASEHENEKKRYQSTRSNESNDRNLWIENVCNPMADIHHVGMTNLLIQATSPNRDNRWRLNRCNNSQLCSYKRSSLTPCWPEGGNSLMPTMRTIGKSWRQERRKTQIAQSVPDQWNKKNREASPPLDFGRSTSSSKVQRLRYQLFGELPVSCRCLFRITRRFYCTFYYRSSSSKSHQISRRLWRTLCLRPIASEFIREQSHFIAIYHE